jgi:hypothetical protein
MRFIPVIGFVLLLGVAACGTPQPGPMYQGGSPMIDVPTPPFPYNSMFCT